MIDETVRLYSKQPRVPVDVILPQHEEVHDDLERWGAWNRDRYQPATCASIEKMYDKGGRDSTPAATAPVLVNPRNEQIDRTVRHMTMRVPEHAAAIRLYYADRRSPQVMCRMLRIHWSDFGTFMGHSRSMVLNIAREIGNAK